MQVAFAQPGVILSSVLAVSTTGVFAAALNQDGSVNSITNPAALGSIVTAWANKDRKSTEFQNDAP